MILTMNGTDYRVKFGVGFVRELDKKYYTENRTGTVKYGLGIETQVPMVMTKDIVTLAEFLYLGTCAEEKRPTQEEIDNYIDQTEDIDGLFDQVIEELKNSNATRIKVGELAKNLREQEEKAKAEKKQQKGTPPKSTRK